VFPNAAGHPAYNGSLSTPNRRVLKHADITKRFTVHGLRRTANDLLRLAAVDPVTRKAIIGHTTDRMTEHYSTVSAEEARIIGGKLVELVPSSTRAPSRSLENRSLTRSPREGDFNLS